MITKPASSDQLKTVERRLALTIRRVTLLLLPLLLGQNWGCQEQDYFGNWDPGPEVTAEEIDRAIGDPALAGDPYTIELGQGVVISETQELVGVGSPPFVSADTVRTIIELKDLPEGNPDTRYLTMIENRFLYAGNETKQVTTEIPLQLDLTRQRAQAVSFAHAHSEASAELTPLGLSSVPVRSQLRQSSKSALSALLGARNRDELRNIIGAYGEISTRGLSSMDERVTYHNLKVEWMDLPPPRAVREQVQCGSVPGCKLKTAAISFDMVFWSQGAPDRMHWKFLISTEAPFLAQIFDRCVTSLVEIGEGASSYLIKQCQPVVNFRYRAL